MKKRVPTIIVEDANWALKVQLTMLKGDPVWILKIELKHVEEKLRNSKDSEQSRLLRLKIRWLRIEILKGERKLLAA